MKVCKGFDVRTGSGPGVQSPCASLVPCQPAHVLLKHLNALYWYNSVVLDYAPFLHQDRERQLHACAGLKQG